MGTSNTSSVETIVLTRDAAVGDSAFTAVEATEGDLTHVRAMLAELTHVLLDTQDTSKHRAPFESTTRLVDGFTHRVLICNEDRLVEHPQLCLVGFFGDRRTGVDIAPLEEANAAVVAEFAKYPGILSYSSVELPDGNWVNIVLHDDPVDTEYWRKSELHARAVEMLSADHYKNVRIHNARLTARLLDRPEVVPIRTKYFDYSGETGWQAVREY